MRRRRRLLLIRRQRRERQDARVHPYGPGRRAGRRGGQCRRADGVECAFDDAGRSGLCEGERRHALASWSQDRRLGPRPGGGRHSPDHLRRQSWGRARGRPPRRSAARRSGRAGAFDCGRDARGLGDVAGDRCPGPARLGHAAAGAVANGSGGHTISFRYTAADGGMANGAVTVEVPAGWSAPSLTGKRPRLRDRQQRGLRLARRPQDRRLGPQSPRRRRSADPYGSTTLGGPGATAPTVGGTQVWQGQERSNSSGTLHDLGASPTITVT